MYVRVGRLNLGCWAVKCLVVKDSRQLPKSPIVLLHMLTHTEGHQEAGAREGRSRRQGSGGT